MLGDLVSSSDTQIYSALTNEGRDVCSGEEDESEREVLYERNVEPRVTVELDV